MVPQAGATPPITPPQPGLQGLQMPGAPNAAPTAPTAPQAPQTPQAGGSNQQLSMIMQALTDANQQRQATAHGGGVPTQGSGSAISSLLPIAAMLMGGG